MFPKDVDGKVNIEDPDQICGAISEIIPKLSWNIIKYTPNLLTAVTGVGSSPALATCETSQVLLAGVSGGFPRVLLFRPHLPIGSSRYECNNLERDIKLNKKTKTQHLICSSGVLQREFVEWLVSPVSDGCWPVCSHSNGCQSRPDTEV